MRRRESGIGRGARGRGMNAPLSTRAVSGLRSEALGPPARSWLTAWVLREPWPEARPDRRESAGRRAERRHAVERSRDRRTAAPLGAPSPSLSYSEGHLAKLGGNRPARTMEFA